MDGTNARVNTRDGAGQVKEGGGGGYGGKKRIYYTGVFRNYEMTGKGAY